MNNKQAFDNMKPCSPTSLPLKELDWKGLLRQTVQANRALAKYEGTLEGVPNPDVLLSPLTTKEAVLSSKIEGTQATLGEVFRYEAGDEPIHEEKRRDIHEIINYRKALRVARDELDTKPFSLNLLQTLHAILLDSVRGKNMARGHFRTVQNWIGSHGCNIEEARFVPPEPGVVNECMHNWEVYYHADEEDALVQLAIVHAQFEIIHPFLDGNGRLGRILVPLFLYEKGLLSKPMFYISAYFEKHREAYVEHLRQLDDNPASWHRWIVFFLSAAEDQAVQSTATAKAIMELYAVLKQQVIDLTRSQFAVPLLDKFFHQPIFKSTHIDLGPQGPTQATINTLLRTLREAGILHVVREGRGRQAQILSLAELVRLSEA